MGYPVLEINLAIIRKNAEIVKKLCDEKSIQTAAVVKGYNADTEIMDVIADVGYTCMASSRIPHLKIIRERGYPVKTMSLRIPMPSEVRSVVEYSDISLNSEIDTIRLLNREARERGRVHDIILMRDLGDLREGIIDRESFIDVACTVEKELHNIHLLGVGANFNCYGSVRPTVKNTAPLADEAEEIGQRIGRRLELISGGASSSVYMAVRGEMPCGINHLRIGGGTIFRYELQDIKESDLVGLRDDSMLLKAEIIEIGDKPTLPIGELSISWLGEHGVYEDRGVRKRALLALGAFDVANYRQMTPLDEGIKILGCSSDHMIIDIHDSDNEYLLGGTVTFALKYPAMLFATANSMVEKIYAR